MDYNFNEKLDVKLIALFIIANFKMPVPNSFVVDTLTLEPFVNYFDLQQDLAELEGEDFIASHVDDNALFYSITEKGTQALEFFLQRIPKTVRERLLRAVKVKVKELKNALSIKAEYKRINDIEYEISLGISEGNFNMFGLSIYVSDELMAKKICAAFKKDPQTMYSDFLSVLTKKIED